MRQDSEPNNPKILGIELMTIEERGLVRLPGLGLFVPNSGNMSTVLRAGLRQYNGAEYLQLLSALMSVRREDPERFNNELIKENRDPDGVLRDYQVRYLVSELFEVGASMDSGTLVHTRDIVMHCEWVVNTLCEADRSVLSELPEDAWALLWRMSYQQFGDLDGLQGFARSLLIYGKFATAAAAKHDYPLKNRFYEITGIGLDEFCFLSMILCGWVIDNHGKTITLDVLSTAKDFPGLTVDIGARFLQIVSCNQSEYVENRLHPKTGQMGYEPYNLNPLLKWPLIEIRKGEYIAPVPTDLLLRASSGIYYDLMPVDRGRFGAVLGDAFQEYVGQILTGLPGIPQIYPEKTYVDNGNEKVTCDWIILDGDTCVLIECKYSAINAMSKITGDRSLIRSDLTAKHGFVDGAGKLFETEQAIRSHLKGLEQFKDVDKFYGIVVVLDDFYMPNSPVIRDMVSEELKKKNLNLEDRIQFTHIGGLEWLGNLLSHTGTSIARALFEKTRDAGNVELDFKYFVPAYSRQVLEREEIIPWTPLFDEAYEEFKNGVVARLKKQNDTK